MRTFILTVLFVFVAGMAFAADIDGNWEGEMEGMGGGPPMKISYTFKADGNTLTGSTKSPMDQSDLAITDGKIDGNKISYSLDFGMGQPMTIEGTLKGDTIEIPIAGGPGGGEGSTLVLKKVK